MNALKIVHGAVKKFVSEGDVCIDATAGRGYDTAFLAELVGETGKVIAFDIQSDAVACTKKLLESRGLKGEVYLDSHANMHKYASEKSVKCIMFNLGYLPGGDHSIFTSPESSIPAIREGLDLLVDGGLMTVTVYSGGATGYRERDEILPFLSSLDSDKYQVLKLSFNNWKGDPPLPFFIIKNPESLE